LTADGGSFTCQDEKSSLKCILGVVPIAQDPAADAQDHRPVAAHQLSKRGFILPSRKEIQQFAVS
jgi:hypothetical protein